MWTGAELRLMAGTDTPLREPWEPFDLRTLDFLSAVSRLLRAEKALPEELRAFGFWCRRSHLEALEQRHRCPDRRLGRGLVVHIAPANVPTMFAYSFALGLLAGNANVVRLSERIGTGGLQLCSLLKRVLDQPEFAPIRARTAFVLCPHGAKGLMEQMASCDGRVIWGGDGTIRALRNCPVPPWAVELCFPDRWSMALLSQRSAAELEDDELELLAHRFCRDTYSMDQLGCSSPQLVLWLEDGGERSARQRWWQAVARQAAGYELTGWRVVRKLERVCLEAVSHGDVELRLQRFGGNLLFVADMERPPASAAPWKGGFGLFYQCGIQSVQELLPLLSPRTQTLTCLGLDCRQVREQLVRSHAVGLFRVVPVGCALELDTVWDGQDLIDGLSRRLT